MPALDRLILIGVHHGLGIAETPWPRSTPLPAVKAG